MAEALPETLAAVDLGSNSFHMVVARVVRGQPVVVDRLREQVRLAAGLDGDGFLDASAARRAVECLQRFGQRIRNQRNVGVRAVATNTLREARNAEDVRARSEEALGYPIEVISGREEARLIYLGVCHTTAPAPGPRLVVDIGGGSTECILGEAFDPTLVDSLYMGCVRYSQRFFGKGTITKKRMEKAMVAGRLEMRTVAARMKGRELNSVVGASGTIRACADVLRENGWSEHGISRDGLARLRQALVDIGNTEDLNLPGLKPERAPVFPGGIAVLSSVFDALELETMTPSSGALREGVLYDLLGRYRHEDVRDRTIQTFCDRYHVDLGHARRVEATALGFLDQVREAWQLDREPSRRFLSWAARLHEVGLAVAYSGHHRHGAYLVENSDMPGFSRDDQRLLATLVRGHRRKLRPGYFRDLTARQRHHAIHLAVLLRLAVRFRRGRRDRALPGITLKAKPGALRLKLPDDWVEEHPLTREDLANEAHYWRAIGLKLKV